MFYPMFAGWDVNGHELRLRYQTGFSSQEYGDAAGLQLTIAFPEQDDELHILLELENKQETPFIESGSLVLPFAGKAAFQIGKPGGVIDPETDIQHLCNHALFNLERQVTAITETTSISICSADAVLFGIGSTGVYEYRKSFGKDRDSTVYFNSFNNMWGTNFPQWIGGSFRYRFVLRANVSQPQSWAAEICRGSTACIPDGMELLSARVDKDILFITLRDLTGKAENMQLCVTGAELCQTDILHKLTGFWTPNTLPFTTRPYSMHVFAIRKG